MISRFTDSEILYALEWLIRLGMLLVVPFRRSPAATRTWLLLIFFLPIPGLLLFLLIGSPRFPAWRMERFQQTRAFHARLRDRLAGARRSAGAKVRKSPNCGAARRPAGGRRQRARADRGLRRRHRPADRRHRRAPDIMSGSSATSSPTMRSGCQVIDALGRAAARGVACHVLIDGVGSHHWIRGTLRALQQRGVEARAGSAVPAVPPLDPPRHAQPPQAVHRRWRDRLCRIAEHRRRATSAPASSIASWWRG